jgi:hypothetical protein
MGSVRVVVVVTAHWGWSEVVVSSGWWSAVVVGGGGSSSGVCMCVCVCARARAWGGEGGYAQALRSWHQPQPGHPSSPKVRQCRPVHVRARSEESDS